MARPCKYRRVGARPVTHAFKPAGVPGRALECVTLGLDELEALHLADGEGLQHASAAKRMGVSRPTFGRLLGRARHKVATALVTGKMLVFEGGPVVCVGPRVFACEGCAACFEVPHGQRVRRGCPRCGSRALTRVAEKQASPALTSAPAARREKSLVSNKE